MNKKIKENKVTFFNNIFYVNENVLTPRKKTEATVWQAIKQIENLLYHNNELRVVDIGTGSGNILISIAKYFYNIKQINIKYLGIDISEKAIEVAEINRSLHLLEDKIDYIVGDLHVNICFDKSDIVVANLPYLPSRMSTTHYVDTEPDIAKFDLGNGCELAYNLLEHLKRYPPKIAIIENDGSNVYSLKQYCDSKLDNVLVEIYFDKDNLERGIVITWL